MITIPTWVLFGAVLYGFIGFSVAMWTWRVWERRAQETEERLQTVCKTQLRLLRSLDAERSVSEHLAERIALYEAASGDGPFIDPTPSRRMA